MSSKDKENKSVQDKLKQLFRLHKGNLGSIVRRGDLVLSAENERELSAESPLSIRIRAIKTLSDTVLSNKLEERGIEKLWVWTQDLLSKDQPTEIRHLEFAFLIALVRGQHDRLGILRAHFFRVVKQYDHPEDIMPRFELLQALTDNGKDSLYFEEEVGSFLLSWLPNITGTAKTLDYLGLLVNVIKFNASYVDEETTSSLVQRVCVLCCSTNNQQVVHACLQFLDTVVAYSSLPHDSLPQFIGALCRTVNEAAYCQISWKIMRNLLGTHMGHSTLYTMCRILQEPNCRENSILLRGAVFFIKMALWDAQHLTNLRCPPSSVLPSILAAVKAGHPLVNFEAILGVQELIMNTGRSLQCSAWGIILQILADIVKQIEAAPNQRHNATVAVPLHEVLNAIESLIEKGDFNGDEREFYDIIENCVNSRPESSILYLVAYLAKDIIPIKHMWLTNLYNLLHKYFKPEIKTNIRLKVLNILSKTITLHRRQYEDELIDRIVIPHMMCIANDNDIDVRSAVAKLLIDICMDCESKKCLEVLDILERLLNRPFDHADNNALTDAEVTDIKTVVSGLIEVFIKKIHRLPSIHAVRIYKMLVNHLDLHYARPKLFENCNQPRLMIFKSFIKLRADHMHHLGYPDENDKLKYSSYLCVTYKGPDRGLLGSPPPPSPAISQQPPCVITHLSLRHSFKIVITCLKVEKDWEVLQLLLQEIPKVLQNKSFVLTKEGNNEVDLLVDALCAMVTEKSLSLPESLNARVSRADFHSLVLPVVASLSSYHNYIDPPHQQKVIRCLVKYGSAMRCSSQCISALTICTLEMRDVMVKLLPETLLSLSKISATVYIAIPLLEFLSTLTQLPMVFANFVADQYMAVFAISLPYTNPFKYNHYTVSLAHHVIAVWFLKCRLPFRKDFVKFITNSLQTNALTPFEHTHLFKQDLSKLNQDSSDRKRSSSLTEQSSRRRERTITRGEGRPTFEFHQPVIDKTLFTFYEELTETCIDLMARYTFSPCSASPKRLPTAEFLLSGGQSMTWLVGNRVITVTTSGCSQIPLKHGLCDKCWNMCKVERDNETASRSGSHEKEKEDAGSNRASRQNSDDKSNNTSASSPVDENKRLSDKLIDTDLQKLVVADAKMEKQACACWCQGWAEIYVRRPTGDMSWVMRIQNQVSSLQSIYEFPLNEVSTLFMPSLSQTNSDLENSDGNYRNDESTQEEYASSTMPISIPGSPQNSPSRQNSRDSVDEDLDYDDGSKSRNPVRRSNSSPEMSANWKNPFLLQKQQERERDDNKNSEEDTTKKVKNYPKDARVSCEAIPEEIAGMGTTPPSNEPMQVGESQQSPHPTLLSCHSYPGSSESAIPAKPCKTVPPSPNVVQNPSATKAPTIGALRGSKSDSSDSTGSEKHVLSNLTPLSAKPPQSPTQTSPRLPRHASFKEREREKKGHEVQKSSSLVLDSKTSMTLNISLARDKLKERKSEKPSDPQKRDRAHTISSMTSARKPRTEPFRPTNTRPKEPPKSGINPSFVFLQLFHSAYFGNTNERPMVVDSSQVIQRSLKVLDCIPPYETHTIGVIYIRQGQAGNETEILRNCYGSHRYVEFLKQLGTVIKLHDADPQVVFLGGLEQNGEDGKFAYVWQDDVIRVAFHVTTLMPNKDSDPNCNNKKRHIGNNNVTIVYNESGEEYNFNTIKSQFNFASVIIQPLDYNTNRVTVKTKKQLTPLLGEAEPKIVSDQNVAILARQLALHANLASLVSISVARQPQDPYASNWLERLRKIKNIKTKILQESKKEQTGYGNEEPPTRPRRGQMEDFTEYT